jgi:hypothetical protein
VAEINAAIDRWADSTITDKMRRNTPALELARLDELQQVFFTSGRWPATCSAAPWSPRLSSGAGCCAVYPCRRAVLQIVDASTPREAGIDRIEQLLNASIEDQKKGDLTSVDRRWPSIPSAPLGKCSTPAASRLRAVPKLQAC